MSYIPLRIHKNNFDFLRLIFSLFVIITHSYPLTGLPEADWLYQITNGQLSFSYLGVRGFFILSGYLIFQSQLRSKGILDYFWKRGLRLFPGLAVALFMTIVIAYFVYEGGGFQSFISNKNVWTYLPYNLRLIWPQLGINGVFEHNPFPSVINGSIWTIQYEFLCYVLIAIFFFIKRKQIIWIGGIFVFFFICRVFFFESLADYRFIMISGDIIEFSVFFFSGSLLAAIKIENFKNQRILAIVSTIILIFSLYFNFFIISRLIFLPIVIIITGLSATPVLKDIGKKIGDLSYGIYIYAFPVQQTLVYFFNMNHISLMLCSTIITLGFGFASWHLIEKRALKFKNKLSGPVKSTNKSFSE